MLENFNHQNLVHPKFNSPGQQEEWDELIRKQQKEKEEFLKKWENQAPKKTY